MAITVNLYYTGTKGSAAAFAQEMIASGTVEAIRLEEGNLQYEYFQPLEDPETILLIDSWQDQPGPGSASCITDDDADFGTAGEV